MTRIRLFGGIALVVSLSLVGLLVPGIAATQQPTPPKSLSVAGAPATPPAAKAGTTYIPVGVASSGVYTVAYLIAVPPAGNPYAVACLTSAGSVPECQKGTLP